MKRSVSRPNHRGNRPTSQLGNSLVLRAGRRGLRNIYRERPGGNVNWRIFRLLNHLGDFPSSREEVRCVTSHQSRFAPAATIFGVEAVRPERKRLVTLRQLLLVVCHGDHRRVRRPLAGARTIEDRCEHNPISGASADQHHHCTCRARRNGGVGSTRGHWLNFSLLQAPLSRSTAACRHHPCVRRPSLRHPWS